MLMMIQVAISMGDPSGIGPEVILRALQHPQVNVHYHVFGDKEVFHQTAQILGCSLPGDPVNWHFISDTDHQLLQWGRSQTLEGKLQVQSLEAALEAVMEGPCQALCTAPITKVSAQNAGFSFPGHTEYLAERCQVSCHAMMLAGPRLRVVPLTGHIALSQVPAALDIDKIVARIVLTVQALASDFGIRRPRIALAALNPHGGESGLMGREEQTILLPSLNRARRQLQEGPILAELSGPIPSDSIFLNLERFDAVICCYHDQAMIPLKMLHRDDGVNVTLGLPIVRTSPAHGSALDIAGQGKADPGSMVAALEMAIQMVQQRAARG